MATLPAAAVCLVSTLGAAPHRVHPKHFFAAALAEHRIWMRARAGGGLGLAQQGGDRWVRHGRIIASARGGVAGFRSPHLIQYADGMDERSRVLLTSLLGAALGGVVGYLYMTENGQRVRDQIDPALDTFGSELQRARDAGEKVKDVAKVAQQTLNSIVGEGRARTAWDASTLRQAAK